jgi:hypothetical protein
MFENSLYSEELLAARHASKALPYFQSLSSQCSAASHMSPGTFWTHHLWVPNDCDEGCCRPSVVLRFPLSPPSGLDRYIPLHQYQHIMRDVNTALAPRDGCVSKCCGLVTFILLFYTTIVGILVYMCCEACLNRRGLSRARRQVQQVLAGHNSSLGPLGIRIVARYNPLLPEGLDTGVGESGEEIQSIPFLCFIVAQQQGGQLQPLGEQQYAAGYVLPGAFFPPPAPVPSSMPKTLLPL